MNTQIAFPAMVKEYRIANSLTMEQLAEKIGKTKSTISKWEKGTRSPKIQEIEELANFFGIDPKIMMFGDIQNNFPPQVGVIPSTLQKVTYTTGQLEHKRQLTVLNTAESQLEEQLAEQRAKELKQQKSDKPKKGIVSELFEERHQRLSEKEENSLHAITGTTASAAASGLGRGYGYDDSDTYTVYTEEEPPKKYSFATMVKGDSMMPEYKEGDMLYLHDKGISSYSGMLAVVAYGDRTYFKKIYTEDEHLRLVSLNEKYEDILLDFPPSEDTHIRIFEVVGSFTPVEM
ncbi:MULTISPECIES: helix-turn-helix domain-containing protein [unclassified Streptococcus]|uniref:helix-turn-helix domain-containing protein n=1 Tax=unclassified Streptococcus TaxID=2608887 RepID=UPI00211B4072|nr:MULTISPECIES: helix-turn-helix domain-containing protein [unclassified Streptococcus]MCQ9212252.1 helix-turn-helix domain-containing protein [Streptococcus sp. B01]MCQ9213583.1 helix-turn-helix domain-containing protein [Streptococcus sp. O1]